jgi:hypothetical protein
MRRVGGGFHFRRDVGQRQAEDQRDGKLTPIVAMKLQLGQEIAQ